MRSALMLAPEAPYPVAGGGPLRTACLLEYLARRYEVDLITFQEPGAPDPRTAVPPGLVRKIHVIALPFHSKGAASRAVRNLKRYARKIPPLVDRFAGFELPLSGRYDLAVVEHFWCAPYVDSLRAFCDRVVLDLHNVESVLLARSAEAQGALGRKLMRSFADASRRMESELLPRFDLILATSADDRDTVRAGVVWPNTIPLAPRPDAREKREEIVFSGNMAYQPNLDAVHYFASAIWPVVREGNPRLTWRLAGKNPEALKLAPDSRIVISGPMEDAVSEIARARVSVAPLRSGSGTRFKIIEAWAAGTPVVSTTIGAEGLEAVPGEHLLIADEPRAFAAAILSVVQEPTLASRLAASGRAFYEDRFTWPIAWKMLEAVGL